MKTAILCNGPSRNLYSDSSKYNYVIGCNIPWTKVNSTVIMDAGVLEKWEMPCAFYSSDRAWREFRKRDRFKDHLIEIFPARLDNPTSGHAALQIVISLGATKVDIYGCDSWLTDNTDSYTHQWVDSRAIDMSKQVSVWRQKWNEIISNNPDISINFIGEYK
jgi:hypothetical protein